MKKFKAVILAAGKGTRMKSSVAKVLHPLAGKPLIGRVIESVAKLRPESIIVVVGSGSGSVKEYLATLNAPIEIVYQREQLGSGHALKQAASACKNYNGDILVLSGDVPLIQTETLKCLLAAHNKKNAGATVLSADVKNPFGYGRMVAKGGELLKIVEEKDASAEEKKITEINSGIYCFSKIVWDVLPKIKNNNAKKEYYITDTIALIERKISVKAQNEYEVKGINTRTELAEAETFLQSQVSTRLMNEGVSIVQPHSTYVSPCAVIGQDTTIYPNVFIGENVKIGKNCYIGAGSYIVNSVIADGVKIEHSYINSAKIASGVKIGPFAHLRPGAVLEENVRVGNFSEVKKSTIGAGAKVNHLSYIGDSSIGKNVNIGAGTITCNYDGKTKSRTVIGENVFVGSNVNFVAPVKIGKGALIAAGSTVTENVPPNALALARARQIIKKK